MGGEAIEGLAHVNREGGGPRTMRAVRSGSYSSAFLRWITNWVKVSPMLMSVEDVQALVSSGRTVSWWVYLPQREPRSAAIVGGRPQSEATLRQTRRFAFAPSFFGVCQTQARAKGRGLCTH